MRKRKLSILQYWNGRTVVEVVVVENMMQNHTLTSKSCTSASSYHRYVTREKYIFFPFLKNVSVFALDPLHCFACKCPVKKKNII